MGKRGRVKGDKGKKNREKNLEAGAVRAEDHPAAATVVFTASR